MKGEFIKKANKIAKRVECMQEERDRLRARVGELEEEHITQRGRRVRAERRAEKAETELQNCQADYGEMEAQRDRLAKIVREKLSHWMIGPDKHAPDCPRCEAEAVLKEVEGDD